VIKINLLRTPPKNFWQKNCYAWSRKNFFFPSTSNFLLSFYRSTLEKLPKNFLAQKEVLIIGMGNNFEEARLILNLFPNVKKIHIVEWNEKNPQYIRQYFKGNEKIVIHLADAEEMLFLSNGQITLAYFSGVLDLHDECCAKQIIKELIRVVEKEGKIVSFDLNPYVTHPKRRPLYSWEEVARIFFPLRGKIS